MVFGRNELMAEPIILPPKYYLTYFDYLIGFVQKMYGHLLTEEEIRFIYAYQALEEDARCLFIRMSNRKGTFFKPESFSYPEIEDISASLEILIRIGFASRRNAAWSDRISDLLDVLTKSDLLRVAGELKPVIMPPRNIKRADLVRWLTFEYDNDLLMDTIVSNHPVVSVSFSREVDLMKFLFFGNRHDDMTEFVIRDLGHVRFQSFDDEALSQKFQKRKEIDDALTISYLREAYSEQITAQPPEEVFDWLMLNHSELVGDLSELAKPSLERLVLKAAGAMERNKLFPQALELYQLTAQAPARERKVRLLYKLGYAEEAQALCMEMVNAPQNADELYFGQDFLEKIAKTKKKVIRQTTLALNDADAIELPIEFKYQVELGAAYHYSQMGYGAFFSENIPWRSLFGLLFWDIIYDTNVQAIHHPLQRIPSDFFLPDFYQKRAHLLREQVAALDSMDRVQTVLKTRFEEKYGTANVLVGWHEDLLTQVLTISDLLSVDQLHSILMEMATDLRDKTRGFPDLLIWNDQEYSFVEIKSPTDHLSSRQLYWQHFFKEIGVSSKIVRVKWA